MTQSFPDGLSQRNLEARAWPSALSFILLACLMLAGLAGVFGGQPSTTKQVEGEAILKVTTPTVLRNGMFFETIVEVHLQQPVEDLVIGVSDPLWQDITVNTMIPAAGEESYKDGSHRF